MNKKIQLHPLNNQTLPDNAPNLINPLLVEEVVEHLFTLVKNAEGVSKIGYYRLVCKLWDQEISKLTRSDTKINLETILLPYPEGMGWVASEDENIFQYSVPNPKIQPFENINLGNNCWEMFPLRERKLEKWFKLMGTLFNTLAFEFSLSDFDKNSKFLEKILKIWCPNLQSISLGGILPAKHIIFVSLFTETTKEIICKNLREVKIIGEIIGDFTFINSNRYTFVLSQQFNQFIYQHGLPGCRTEFPECKNRSGMKVLVPRELLNKSEFPDVSQFIPENFFPKVLDGGVLGQIMSSTSVERLSMLKCINPENFGTLVAFSHFWKNCWRSSLKRLELYVSQMEGISRDLVVFAKLGYPITTLKFKEDYDDEDPIKKTENMTRFLAHFTDTLQYLEYIGTITNDSKPSTKLVLPVLPKLKTFIYKSMMDCPLCPINVLTNLPNLEKFYLDVLEYSRNVHEPAEVYKFLDKDIGNIRNDSLKILKVTASISGIRGCKLLKWFPKVERLILNVDDEYNGIATFLNQLASSGLKNFKIRFSFDEFNVGDPLRNNELTRKFGQLKGLKSLEIDCGGGTQPLVVTSEAFSEEFKLLTQLQVLRLTKFVTAEDDQKRIQGYLNHIPLVQFKDWSYLQASFFEEEDIFWV